MIETPISEGKAVQRAQMVQTATTASLEHLCRVNKSPSAYLMGVQKYVQCSCDFVAVMAMIMAILEQAT